MYDNNKQLVSGRALLNWAESASRKIRKANTLANKWWDPVAMETRKIAGMSGLTMEDVIKKFLNVMYQDEKQTEKEHTNSDIYNHVDEELVDDNDKMMLQKTMKNRRMTRIVTNMILPRMMKMKKHLLDGNSKDFMHG